MARIIQSFSDLETKEAGRKLGSSLPKNSVVCLFGDLGAGKTTFMKGFAEGAAGYPEENVSSPTFNYLHIYEGKVNVYHFDLYRLKDANDFLSMGFDEFLNVDGICCIEWSERIQEVLPEDCIHVTFTHTGQEKREITITK